MSFRALTPEERNRSQHQTRGARNEAAVVRALRAGPRPWWLRSVRFATLDEDRRGIDVVVETRDGEALLLQVKSSRRKLGEFRRRHRRCFGPPVGLVVADETDLELTFWRALGALIALRDPALAGPHVIARAAAPG